MLRYILVCLLLIFSATSYCQDVSLSDSFVLKGRILDRDTGTVVLQYTGEDSKYITDTAKILNSRFALKGQVNKINVAYFISNTRSRLMDDPANKWILLEPGITEMEFYSNNARNATVNGGMMLDEQKSWDAIKEPEKKLLDGISKKLDSLKKLMFENKSSASTERMFDSLGEKRSALINTMRKMDLKYIAQNQNSLLSPVLLWNNIYNLTEDSVAALYNFLEPYIFNTSIDRTLKKSISQLKSYKQTETKEFDKLAINKPAPKFSIYKNKKEINSNLFKGKVVVLEFWGVYCLPCIKAFPKLHELRKKFKNIEIITINFLDEDDEQRFNAISKKFQLQKFTNVIHSNLNNPATDLKYHKGDFSNYNIYALPTTVVLSKTNNIIYKSIGVNENYFNELESIIKKENQK